MSGKDDFDDEGLPLLPKHTKVRHSSSARARGDAPFDMGKSPLAMPCGPRFSSRRLARTRVSVPRFFSGVARGGRDARARASPRARPRGDAHEVSSARAHPLPEARFARAPAPPPRLPSPRLPRTRTRRAERDLPVGRVRRERGLARFRETSAGVGAESSRRVAPVSTDGSPPSSPANAQVRVTGNNRTKPGVIGLRGVVRKAVGLGGWHWLRLENGAECRLQRNALAVVARPTGLELDSESEDDELDIGYGRGAAGTRAGHASAHELLDTHRAESRNHAPSLALAMDTGAGVGRPRRASRPPRRTWSRDDAGTRRAGAGGSASSASRGGGAHQPSVRFDKLRRETLEKISAKHYRVDPRSAGDRDADGTASRSLAGAGKRERADAEGASGDGHRAPPEKRALVETIAARFTSETVDETEVLIAFIKMLAGGALPSPNPSNDAP